MAELYSQCGIPLVRAPNAREQGWMMLSEELMPGADAETGEPILPGMRFFESCERIYSDLKALLHDDDKPNDVAKEPHDITHGPDALRYFCSAFKMKGEFDMYEANQYDDDMTEAIDMLSVDISADMLAVL